MKLKIFEGNHKWLAKSLARVRGTLRVALKRPLRWGLNGPLVTQSIGRPSKSKIPMVNDCHSRGPLFCARVHYFGGKGPSIWQLFSNFKCGFSFHSAPFFLRIFLLSAPFFLRISFLKANIFLTFSQDFPVFFPGIPADFQADLLSIYQLFLVKLPL